MKNNKADAFGSLIWVNIHKQSVDFQVRICPKARKKPPKTTSKATNPKSHRFFRPELAHSVSWEAQRGTEVTKAVNPGQSQPQTAVPNVRPPLGQLSKKITSTWHGMSFLTCCRGHLWLNLQFKKLQLAARNVFVK